MFIMNEKQIKALACEFSGIIIMCSNPGLGGTGSNSVETGRAVTEPY